MADCNGQVVTVGPYTVEGAPYCFNSDLTGSITSQVNQDPNDPYDYDILGEQVIVIDTSTTPPTQLLSTSTFNVSPNGSVPYLYLNFTPSQFSPTPSPGDVLSATFYVCARLSTVDSGTCSNWVALSPVLYETTP